MRKAAAGALRAWSLGPNGTQGEHVLTNHSSDTYRFVPRGASHRQVVGAPAVISPAKSIVSCSINWDGTAPSRIRINNGAPVDLAIATVIGTVPASDLGIGSNTNGVGNYWNGDLYALFGVFHSLALSDAVSAVDWANGKTAAY